MNTDKTQISQSKEATARQQLTKLQRKWRKYKSVELLLWALSISVLAMAAVYLVVPWSAGALTGTGALLAVWVWGGLLWWRGLRQITLYDVAQYLNKHHPTLENSSELLLLPEEDLNLLAKMQRQKVSLALLGAVSKATLPHQLPKAALTLLGSGMLASLLFTLNFGVAHLPKGTQKNIASDTLNNTTQLPKHLPASIQSIQAIVQAPAYTRLGAQVAPELNIKAVENSMIRWKVRFKGDITQAAIVFNTGDSLRLQPNPQRTNEYVAQWRLKEKGFYQLVFRQTTQKAALSASNEWQSSEFFSLTPVPDTRPKLSLAGINDYEELEFKPNIDISFNAKITDDYGVTDAYIVATVSKGQGESVKFREQKLRFGNFVPGRRSHQLHKTLNLQKLGMAPGDELYFFVEAIDNKNPQAQKGRTEMFFVSIQDTTREQLTAEMGNGVNKLPDYFRSQRQLIIDTEKLLRNKATMPRDSFEYRSNGIGVDQKILRLRYGKFLGEEYEVSIGGDERHDGHNHDHEHHKHDDKGKRDTVRYKDKKTGKIITEVHYEGDGHGDHDHGHSQWKKRTSSLEVLKRNEKDHKHRPKSAAPSNNPNDYVPTSVMHLHNLMEEATFFDEVLKKQLKEALVNMWQSELHLRTHRPKASLPYQYKALKLIKQIQQKSRVYVERIGFEPPPIKEKEKRLKGELEDIRNVYKKRNTEAQVLYPNIRKVLPLLEQWRNHRITLPTIRQKQWLRAAGSELATVAIDKPGQFLTALKTLQKLTQDQLTPVEINRVLPYLINALWRALPQKAAEPGTQRKVKNRLLEIYLNKLGR
ncbi:hypothetical protein [uncultured Microscilla sp.]|uniref:hypothetical protein n=1 Tax=uncultured Microscilla sp. TaxID=432653 RepID=UPI00260C7405|nr:hypothetical protein [uncultured Microscilla sp.]